MYIKITQEWVVKVWFNKLNSMKKEIKEQEIKIGDNVICFGIYGDFRHKGIVRGVGDFMSEIEVEYKWLFWKRTKMIYWQNKQLDIFKKLTPNSNEQTN